MLTLDGYNFSENLYLGTRTEVYRGTRTSENKPVIIKVLRNLHPNFNQLVQFRNQYVITRNLEHNAIVRPLALERYGNGYALVMPDEGAIALSDYWPRSDRSLTEFIAIAMELADALHYLTGQRIVHKDIKPANILIHPETGKVKLIDFSISSLLPTEQQQLINPNVLEGTLAYIAPEQTGRMNRGIDYRSDFYSLGATLYQLLTGVLPFPSSDPMELVHCHISQQPVPPGSIKNKKSNIEIPLAVSQIVMKLMAKNAEDRYQSALGLKLDLENCLKQWKETGKIEAFELATRDIAGRFLIPEKLYGRETEVKTLLAAFDRVASGQENQVASGRAEMMLVAGFSGIGKTAVVNEVHKPIVRQRGYFIKGKFDQFQRNIPFSAFVQAFRNLMEQLLSESDALLAEWQEKILAALGENGQVILDVIPELELLIGKQPTVPELSGSAAQNRFNLLFQKFIKVFTTPDHPLVIFLDDLQWADSASLKLMELLNSDREMGYLLLLGAYRDNEVYPAHPLMLTLDEIGKSGASVNTITLAPLRETDLNSLVADTLSCSQELAWPLTELVYQKTKGNPFFATQFLKGLHEDGFIAFDRDRGYWHCDMTRVHSLALTDDVVEFMASRLHKLPQATQKILKLAACIGNQFDLETLAIVSEQSQMEVAASLWKALQEGLVLPLGETYKFFQGSDREEKVKASEISVGYKFLHDRVQQAAYSLIPDDQKQITHYHIGQLLLEKIAPEAREDRIFELVSQLNYGTALITEHKERDELAGLNLIACRKARAATAYQAGRSYASTGLSLLGENAWQRQYEMTLAFHDFGAEFASLCGDLPGMEQFVETVIAQAHSLLEKVNVYRILILAKVSQHQLNEAIASAQKLLLQLGVTFPENPTPNDIQEAIAEIENILGDREIEDLVNLPKMKSAEKIAILQIADSIMIAASISGSPLFPLLVALSVKLSIQHGNTSASAYAYVCYGLIACNLKQDVNTGGKFGQLALGVVSKQDAKTVKPEVLVTTGLFILHRKSHLKETLPLLQEGYTSALEVGNQEFAGYNGQCFCLNSFWCGQPLATLEQGTRAYCNGLVQLNQLTTANWCRIYWQVILNLLGVAEHPQEQSRCILSGDVLQEAEFLPRLLEASDFFGLYLFYLYKLMLGYLFGELESTHNHAVEARRYLMGAVGSVGEPVFYFYDSLVALAQLSPESSETSEIFGRVEQNQTQLQQHWADHAPMNHQHKVDLVAAEKCRVKGQKLEALELYDKAIASAKANEYIQEEALANELAAKFYLDWGKEKVASGYMQEAYYCYARWGAKAKTDQLETQYPQLLTPILQQTQSNVNLSRTLKETQALGTATTTSSFLDLASAIKAGQAISEEISLDALLSKVMRIVVENAGADRGSLILNHSGRWEIVAQCVNTNCKLSTIPLDDASTLPLSIINTVRRTQQTLLINDIDQDKTFPGDTYLIQQQPLCLFCTPIVHQGQLRGILYLENNLTAGAFTSDRIEVLNLLTAQAAISIENAQLYNTLEQKVKERTAELSQALEDLKATQKQLVESEKMAALGGLVAGVAHEINTPIGTSITLASTLADETQSFLNAVKQGQLKRSVLNNYLDLADQSTQLMLTNLHRAGELIGSFKQIATDQSHLEARSFHLKEYLEEVAGSLAPQLKQTPHTLTVAGSEGITIESYPGALAQIVTNLVTNSLTHGYPSGEAGQLRLQIGLDGDRVQVEYSDDGCGISQENLGKIFEPFFTTARNKGGTGLGLHIVYNLVTQKLLGTMEVSSEVGKGTKFAMTLPLSINE